MNDKKRRDAAVTYASFLGFERGECTLLELDDGFGLFTVGGVEYLVVRSCEVVGGEEPEKEPVRGGFAEMAKAAGLPEKTGYTPKEVALATGVNYTSVCRCATRGELRSYLPRGMKRGRLMTPAMVDDWLRGGSDA